jgi:hypothetical protein
VKKERGRGREREGRKEVERKGVTKESKEELVRG